MAELEASTLLPLTTSLVLALPLGVIAMATGILVRAAAKKRNALFFWWEKPPGKYLMEGMEG